MRFKLDENLPREAAQTHSNAGHDALTIHDQKMVGELRPGEGHSTLIGGKPEMLANDSRQAHPTHQRAVSLEVRQQRLLRYRTHGRSLPSLNLRDN